MDSRRIDEKATMICKFHKDWRKGCNHWVDSTKMGKKQQVDFTRIGENATMIGGFDMDQ